MLERQKIQSLLKMKGAGYLLAFGAVAGFTVVGYRLNSFFTETDVIMLFLVGAVIVAATLGLGPALLYSLLSVSALNYFFVQPLFTFSVSNPSWWLTFAVMFFACLVISTLAARLRDQVMLSRRREHEARMLYELMKDLATSGTREEMSEALLRRIAEALPSQARVTYPDGAAFGAETLQAAPHLLPIRGTKNVMGNVEITGSIEPDQTIMMETFVDLLGSALERSETAQAAEQAKVLAEKEKMRNILLSSVSHDLRSPLAAITGAAETLLQSAPENRLLESIRQEAARLAKIVGNLLDITRIEGGHIRLNMRAYDPAEIIGSVVETCRPALKNHRLSLHVDNNLPFVRMDGLLMSQLLQNLLENAARHAPAGTQVDIGACMKDGGLCITVSDNGPGIAAGQEQAIFTKFATYGHGDRPKGAGLGLAICLSIATAHQGRIYAENKKEGCSRFTVELPAALTLPAEREAAHAE